MERDVRRREILARAQQRLSAVLGHRIDHEIKQVERTTIAVARAVTRLGLDSDFRYVNENESPLLKSHWFLQLQRLFLVNHQLDHLVHQHECKLDR